MSLGQQGVLQSPNFPNNYPANMNIKKTFVAENHNNIIQINFTHSIMEEDYDTLTVCLKDVCSEEEEIVLTGIMVISMRYYNTCLSQNIYDVLVYYKNSERGHNPYIQGTTVPCDITPT